MNSETITISVNRLRLRSFHGVGEQEQCVGNDFEVSVSVCYPPALLAAKTDSIDHTLSYADIVAIVREQMDHPARLLEHVCAKLRDALTARYPAIASGKITVAKLLPPIPGVQLQDASVTLTW
ncbi:MAG: dihydroneopterin aldolase [Firmicutes bacterium]|nr:dihydroneopterin aldolase [Bacillota bacterium]MCM1400446.1 dihydroneopterin aldolase [Bacteroides sp.]MCM1476914.1 dihydroneopterin aldolase [Bacteroides sp.]